MADVNVLDLSEVTPGSGDSLILFDRATGVATSTRFETLKSAVTGDVNATVAQHTSQIQTLTNETNDIFNVLGAKNMLPNTATTQVINGITFTVNDDGSVTANGTATADAAFQINALTLPKGTYALNGCPSGGTGATYRMYILPSGKSPYYDDGNGVQFAVTDNTILYYVRIVVFNGQTVSNFVFKPMIRLASIVDNTYVPYAMTNAELTNNVIKQQIDVTITDGTNHTATIEPLANGYNPFQCLSYQNQFVVGQRLLYRNKLQVKFEAGAQGLSIPCYVYYRKRG